MMAWSSSSCDDEVEDDPGRRFAAIMCPSCGRRIQADSLQASSAGIQDLPGLPAGVKFDPTDQELLEHLEGKAGADLRKLHPLIDDFIPTIEGDNGICYTHPEKLPGVGMDGLIRHFFHRPSRAYTTGNRKRRKVKTDEEGGETRWHKTGKTRPIFDSSKSVKGHKKILVLYANYGKRRKPEKTNWVMHQYHLGPDDEEKEGELVVSKIFYQTQPRQCGPATPAKGDAGDIHINISKAGNVVETIYCKEYCCMDAHVWMVTSLKIIRKLLYDFRNMLLESFKSNQIII